MMRKINVQVFVVLLVRLIQSIPQRASDTPFRDPMQAISHLKCIDFTPEKSEKQSITFIISIRDSLLLEKSCIVGTSLE